MQPHVFVVMPFGRKEARAATRASGDEPERPAVNVDFDEVYELLIKPALTKAGCVAFRADQEPGAGDIRTDMYFELVTADVILADISVLNANVFYELGVRHGVAPRGVLMIHGGWSGRPFDIAPDRTFAYDGQLFATRKDERDDAWQQRLDAQVDQLAAKFENALEVDEQTIGSPVYKELVGLVPVDWSNIQTARAKYFGEVFKDWKGRVEVAKLKGLAGDILTLADDAPTRFHRGKLLWEAADALVSMQRFDVAESVLKELVALEPHNDMAQTQLGLVLARLGKMEEAEEHMKEVAEQAKDYAEAQAIMGCVYKDLWWLEWKNLKTVEERQRAAFASSRNLLDAIKSYEQAIRKFFDYYNGVNAVSFLKLLEHLARVTGRQPVKSDVEDLDELIAVVRFAARNARDCVCLDAGEEGVWADAALAEVELVAGDADRAYELYRDAAHARAATSLQLNAMLEQLRLFESLDFRPEAVATVKKVLEDRINGLKSEPRFKKILVFSGHMIDAPGRQQERFPARKEPLVRAAIERQLEAWNVGAGDLAICGGASGGDLLFAEACAERGAAVWLFLALPEAEFLEESVRPPGGDWESRYFALRDREGVEVFSQPERLKSPPKGTSVYARTNLWMINTARVEADDPKNLYALLVWDEQPTGDGLGGTSDFAARVRRLGGRLAPFINPTKM